MMREFEILTAAMNINRIAKQMTRHRGTFNMPSRATLAPWTGPMDFTWLSAFPQNKILRIFFTFIYIDPNTKLQLLDILPGKLAVIFKFIRSIENITAIFIGKTLTLQFGNKFDNHIHIVSYSRIRSCSRNTQSV
ncbi:hypothetical protein D3C76_1019170 [compost metagenome]